MSAAALYLGDCRELLRWLPDCSVDAIKTDPPYEIGFMGHGWDASGIAFDREVWTEALRVLKPGGHVVAYGAAKTYHWLACAIELAGFEIRDSIPWLQGQGMPKGDDISKRIDAMAGAKREVIGPGRRHSSRPFGIDHGDTTSGNYKGGVPPITAPATPEAKVWAGWNTQIAPRHESAVLARKPCSESTVAANVLRWGVGGLNVGACRLASDGSHKRPGVQPVGSNRRGGSTLGKHRPFVPTNADGRWAPNVTLSEAAAAKLDAMAGRLRARSNRARKNSERGAPAGPSDFFYVAKASTREREHGCEHLRWAEGPNGGFVPWEPGLVLLVDNKGRPIGNPHPTIKPLALIRWLVRMVTPPMAYVDGRPTGAPGLVLDLFMGSGTTGMAAVQEGFRFLGCDITPWAFTIAKSRIRWARGVDTHAVTARARIGRAAGERVPSGKQLVIV